MQMDRKRTGTCPTKTIDFIGVSEGMDRRAGKFHNFSQKNKK